MRRFNRMRNRRVVRRCIVCSVLALSGCANHENVTYADYLSVKPGMRYEEIEHTIGHPGMVLASGQFLEGGIVGTPGEIVYFWKNRDGSNMSVSIKGDRVTSAAQWKLR